MIDAPTIHTEHLHTHERQFDPTRTTALRRSFVAQMNKRFRRLRGLINKAIVEQDCFGLQRVTVQAAPGRRAFDFPRSQQKVSAFMEWLDKQVQNEVLQVSNIEQVGQGVDAAWTNQYIHDSYKRGVQRARYELQKHGFDVPGMEQTGGIQASMSTPFHVDRVGLLYTRTFNELKGITDAMDQQISRVLSQGIVDGDHPRLLARKLNSVISGNSRQTLGITDTLGRSISPQRRARMLARTEVIRAHAQAQIQEYKNWRVEGVNVQAEWVTAGDQRVCPQCSALAIGGPYSLEQAQNMIPAHPQCRCTLIPTKRKPEIKEIRETQQFIVSGEIPSTWEAQSFRGARNYISSEKRGYDLTTSGALPGERFTPFRELADEPDMLDYLKRLSRRRQVNKLRQHFGDDYVNELRRIYNNSDLTLQRDSTFYFGIDGKGMKAIQSQLDVGEISLYGHRYTALNANRALNYAGYSKKVSAEKGALFELVAKRGQKATFTDVFDLPESVFMPGSKLRVVGKTTKQMTKEGVTHQVPVYKVEMVDDGSDFVGKWLNEIDEVDNIIE